MCVSPLAALDSLWQGLSENVSLDPDDRIKYVNFVTDAVKEYGRLAVRDVQRAFEESFEKTAEMLLNGYLDNIIPLLNNDLESQLISSDDVVSERDIREIERAIGIAEREKESFRSEIGEIVSAWRRRGKTFKYTSDPRLRSAIEARLFPSTRTLERGLTKPRFAKQRAEWAQRRSSIARRLVHNYGYCEICSEDVIDYVTAVLKKRATHKTPKNEGVEWMWPLNTGANTSTS